MKDRKLLLLPALCITYLAGCTGGVKADYIMYANTIYTANANGDFAKAIAVKDGRFIYVGNDRDVKKYLGENTREYHGEFIMPSGIETHAHFILEQAFMQSCYIEPIDRNQAYKTKEEILQEIEEYAYFKGVLEGEDAHLFGYGYNQMYVSGYTKEDLDGLCEGLARDYPIYIAETSLHEAWVNSKTLERAGIKIALREGESDPVVGIKRDENGVATGVLTNESCAYVLEKGFRYPILTDVGYESAVKNAALYLNSMGYTGHYDAWSNFDGSDSMFKALHSADKNNELTCFFTTAYNIQTYSYKEKGLDALLDKAVDLRNTYKSKHYDPKFIKLFADGVLETGTGFVKEPYTFDFPDKYGEQIWQQADMDKIVKNANDRDLLVHTHSLGDASFSEAVTSYVKSNKAHGKKIRNSIGHCILIDEADYDKVKENDIGISMNVGWLEQKNDVIDLYEIVVGQERAKRIYPIEECIERGLHVGISTDRPCAEGPINIFDYLASVILGYSPLSGISVSRRESHPTVKQAINTLTIEGAWLANYEDERGSIEVGKYADFVVGNQNPFDCDPKLISNIELKATSFEGKFVYFE